MLLWQRKSAKKYLFDIFIKTYQVFLSQIKYSADIELMGNVVE